MTRTVPWPQLVCDAFMLIHILFSLWSRYEPKRIAYYPDDTIDVVIADLAHASMNPGANLPPSISIHTNSGNQYDPSQMPSNQEVDLTVSTLSLKPALPSPTGALALTPLQTLLSPPLISSNVVTLQQAFIARPMAILSSMALDITQLQQQLEHSTSPSTTTSKCRNSSMRSRSKMRWSLR